MNLTPTAVSLSGYTVAEARALGGEHARKLLDTNPSLATFDPPTLGVFPSPFLPANPLLPANWSWFFGNPRSASGTMASLAKNFGMTTTAAYWEGANAAFVRAWHDAKR